MNKNIDPAAARLQHIQLFNLCKNKSELSEKTDILPLIGRSPDLCLLLAQYIPGIKIADQFAVEFKIYGDFIADLVVGDYANGKYLLVEFEDGTSSSIFSPTNKTAPDWAKRFEGAFSQLVDWLWKLEDMRTTNDFQHVFGRRDASFSGLIVIGKDMKLGPQEENRLKWRQDKVMVDSKGISVLSYNNLVTDTNHWLELIHRV